MASESAFLTRPTDDAVEFERPWTTWGENVSKDRACPGRIEHKGLPEAWLGVPTLPFVSCVTWARDLNSLGLSYLICAMGIILVSITQGDCED